MTCIADQLLAKGFRAEGMRKVRWERWYGSEVETRAEFQCAVIHCRYEQAERKTVSMVVADMAEVRNE